MPRENEPPLAVYVHWPFCARICPYCDFNVYRDRGVDAAQWSAALRRDLTYWAERTKGRRLTSLYFGGGTPSLAPVSVIDSVIDACAELWGFEPGAEIDLEANPTDAETARFAALASAGVNRLSLGVQSFNNAALAFLGRNHDGEAAQRALGAALSAFERVSFDLIYGLPDQAPDEWRRELAAATRLGAGHLSLYQLTIEEGTAFERAVARGKWTPPDDERGAALFEIAQEVAENAGLPAYEISNHALPGAESRHNLVYWTGGDYVGVGPGAHGRVTQSGVRRATTTHLRPADYLEAVGRSGCGADSIVELDAEERLMERLTMGLRLHAGIELGAEDWAQLGDRAERLEGLEDDGLLLRSGARLTATADGRRLLNSLLAEILT